MAGKISTGGGGRGRSQPVVDPNVIPFIDIMLVLLIIFMVTAPTPTVDVRIDLPPPNIKPPEKKPEGKATRVYIYDNGKIGAGAQVSVEVDNYPVSEDQIVAKVWERIPFNNPTMSPTDYITMAGINIRAHPDAIYANVVSVMAKLKEVGFVKVALIASGSGT